MKKFLLLGFLSMFGASQAHAGFIPVINGADMAGIEVTAAFSNGTSETITWSALTADSGGVTGTDWSLTQAGETFGDFDPLTQTLIGAWTLTNSTTTVTLESLFINLLSGFVFDTLIGNTSSDGTEAGRPFASDQAISDSFGTPLQNGLFSTLMLTDIQSGTTQFVADTDQVTVSAPATLSLLLLALGGLVVRRKQA